MIGKSKFFSSLILLVFLLTGCSLGGSSNGSAEESYTIKWKNRNKHLYWKLVFMFLSIWNNSSYLSLIVILKERVWNRNEKNIY